MGAVQCAWACPLASDPAWQIGNITERRQADGYDFEIAGDVSHQELSAIVEAIITVSLQDIKFVTIFSPATADVLTCHPTHDQGGCHSYHLAKLEGAWTICDQSRILFTNRTSTAAPESNRDDAGDAGVTQAPAAEE